MAALTIGCSSNDNGPGPATAPGADGASDAASLAVGTDSSMPSQPDSTTSPGPDAAAMPQAEAGGAKDGAAFADATANAEGGTDAGLSDGGPLDGAAESDAPTVTPVPTAPALLSGTGLFSSVATDGGLVLEDGVQPYQPAYTLWSDGAQKDRWIYLPPGSKVDTTDLDHWSFPVGTKFWKEFDVGGQRIETRLVWRYGPNADDFLYVTYWWNPEAGIANDAELADPDNGAQDVNGTTHDIPTQQDCVTCHGSLEEHVLGFGAIELNHTLPGSNIHTLIEAGALTQNPNLADLVIPGDTTAQAALGYLHANCGNCHNDTPGATGVPDPKMNLRVLVGTKTVEESQTYLTAVNQPTTDFTLIPYRIAGQELDASCVTHDMESRGVREQMPPLASKIVDDAGVATVNAWIMTLPKPGSGSSD
jgi:hypothetical protein